ncbi:MAG: hypothetical protein Q7S28_00430 [bacterium]|nr:hypothetical protein [bacterium]
MPYIPSDPEREHFNPYIDKLAKMIVAESANRETDYAKHLRYCIIRLSLRVLSEPTNILDGQWMKFDEAVQNLADTINAYSKNQETDFAGNLNYSTSRLMLKVLIDRFSINIRYWMTALTKGVLTEALEYFQNNPNRRREWEWCMTKGVLGGVMHEFERRYCDPYEDYAIKKNGDVDLYAQLEAGLRELDASLPGKE